MKTLLIAATLYFIYSPSVFSAPSSAPAAASKAVQAADLAEAGKNNMLPSGGWFTWKLDKKPKLGTLIVIVQAYSKDGKRDTSYDITGESGMPSMHYHDSGKVKFQKNKKGDYLLPVNVVMPGEWRIVIRVKKAKKEIYAGQTLFTI